MVVITLESRVQTTQSSGKTTTMTVAIIQWISNPVTNTVVLTNTLVKATIMMVNATFPLGAK